MFGCPSYTVKDKLFAFLVTDGIVLTKLSKDQLADALNMSGARSFKHNKQVVKKWVQIPFKDVRVLPTIRPLVDESYENAIVEDG
jgi:hypothetical protein